ncbi:MAG TPA: mycothiol synthase [Pseudonocardiaceae bacterium]|nr:mycothiol synthase [Pseudonocardiaceae bacterium]
MFSWAEPDPAALRALLVAVSAVDGRPDLAETGVPSEFTGGEHLLAHEDGELVGYAHLNTGGDSFGRLVGDLLVRPADRGRGIGTELATRLLTRAGVAATGDPGDTLRVWAPGDQPAAAALAGKLGFRPVRRLLRLRMPLTDQVPAARLPDGVTLRAFVPGRDEAAFLEVNRQAFAWHPEQSALADADLRQEEAEPWFDPAGFLLAVDGDDRLLGFHWTKVHPDVDGGPMGEVYVVGVRPGAQGGGLGRALTLAGLSYLRERRAMDRVMLYVESDNEPALAVYRKLGFREWDASVQYAH